MLADHSAKRYACKRCGHEVTQTTNHYGDTWSFGRYNTCPACPPWAKFLEFGGQTVWTCLDVPPAEKVRLRFSSGPVVGEEDGPFWAFWDAVWRHLDRETCPPEAADALRRLAVGGLPIVATRGEADAALAFARTLPAFVHPAYGDAIVCEPVDPKPA